MTRTRASAKKAGSSFETLIADYLREHVADHIERRARNGAKDRGDISGVRCHGKRVVIEAKNCATVSLAAWAAEAEIERLNDDAVAGVIAHKRHGKAAAGEQWITCTVDDFIALLTGFRPDLSDLSTKEQTE